MVQKSTKKPQKIDQNLDLFFDRFWLRFWALFGTKMEPSWDQNRSKNGIMLKNTVLLLKERFLKRKHHFWGSGAPVWDRKSIKNRSKNGVKIEVHFGIDFWSIWGRFWEGFGIQNRPKIDSKNDRNKNIEKIGAKRGQEAQQDPETTRATPHLGRRGGPLL